MKNEELTGLLDELLDGSIEESDFLRLEAELSVAPAARQSYYDRITLSTLLESEAALSPKKIVPIPERKTRPLLWTALAASIAAAVAVGTWFAKPSSGGVAPAPRELHATGFAVVSGQADATWADGSLISEGALLPAGPHTLNSGVAQLELFSGVVVTVEGKAEFELMSPMEMRVTSGKLRAHVPDAAHGFTIHTAEGEVVDLGTEFALNISDDHSELHVIDGEVEWHPKQAKMLTLKRGEALRMDGGSAPLAAAPGEFVGSEEMRTRLASARQGRQARWNSFNQTLKQDPRLVSYFEMGEGQPWSRQLDNSARSGTDNAAAIVAAVRSPDRWGNPTGALDFSRTGSRVRVAVPGEFSSLTMLSWVKIHSLDRWYNSLFLTDGHEQNEPHWQILDDGRLFFSVRKFTTTQKPKDRPDKHICHSPVFWKPAMSGQWLMLATTYESRSGEVRHYLNGTELSHEVIPEEYRVEQVQIGNASLGNWSTPMNGDPRFAVRNLNGSMSEFALFREALSASEIAEIYEHGKP